VGDIYSVGERGNLHHVGGRGEPRLSKKGMLKKNMLWENGQNPVLDLSIQKVKKRGDRGKITAFCRDRNPDFS